jgi:hypothetical protein
MSLLIALTLQTSAQEPVTVAPNVGYDYGVPLALQRSPGIINRFDFAGTGRSYNHTVWFGAEVAFPGLPGGGTSLVSRLTLALSNGRFTSDPFDTFDGINGISHEQAFGSARFAVNATESSFLADLRALQSLGGIWRIGGGVWGSYRIASAFFQTEELLEPSFVIFPDGSRLRTIASGSQLASRPFRAGPIVTFGAELSIGSWLTLRPELQTRLDAGALFDGIGIRSVSGGASMTIAIGTRRPSDSIAPPLPLLLTADEALRRRIAELPPPSATVDLYCSANGERLDLCTIRSRRIRHRQFMQLPGALRFDHDPSGIPALQVKLSPEQANTFSIRSLAGLPTDSLRMHTLNILGLRLRQAPHSQITIRAMRRGDEPLAIARLRAEAVRSYLEEVWGIEPRRLTITIANATSDEEEIEIRSENEEITGPVVTSWIEVDYTMPSIGISRSVNAPGGVRSSELTISQGDHLLLQTVGEEELGRDLDLSLPGPTPGRDPEPLVAVVSVEDYAGRTISARDELHVTVDTIGGMEQEVLTWVQPPGMIRSEREIGGMLGTIDPSTRSGTRITITYPDAAFASEARTIARRLMETLDDRKVAVRELRLLPDRGSRDIVVTLERDISGPEGDAMR